MRAILIDPVAETITEVDVKPGLQPIYDAIKANPFAIVGIDDDNFVYVDDNGMLDAGKRCFKVGDYDLAGNGLILGDETPATISVEQVADLVKWTRLETTGKLGPTTEDYVNHPILGRVWSIIGGKPILKPANV